MNAPRVTPPPPDPTQQKPPTCGTCRATLWWDTTYPYPPGWYCSVCKVPPHRERGPGIREPQ